MDLSKTGLLVTADGILDEFKNCNWPNEFKVLVLHKKPHIEEYGCIVYLRYFGDQVFPGISKAEIQYWEAGTATPDGRSWKEWFADGYLLVGVGGSPFDEHANSERNRLIGHCAASLVAIALGIDKEPWNTKLLRYLTVNDTKGGHHPLELGGITNLLNDEYFEEEQERNITIITTILCAFLRQQQRFFRSEEAFKANAKVYPWIQHQEKTIILVSITGTDDKHVTAYARSKYGAQADVVVNQNTAGNIYISTQDKSNINLDEVIHLIRLEEMKMSKKITTFNAEELKKEGEVGTEIWYYDKQASRIFNGSLRKTVTPTRIPFWRLMDLVLQGLEMSAVENLKRSVPVRNVA